MFRSPILAILFCLSGLFVLFAARPADAQNLRVIQDLRGPSDEATGLVITRDGRHAYSVIDGQTQVWQRNLETGQLTFTKAYPDPDSPGGFGRANRILLSVDDRHLYVRHSSLEGAVLNVFTRDIDTGGLTSIQRLEFADDSGSPGGLVISPDDRHLYVGGQEIGRYLRDNDTGELTRIGGFQVGDTSGLVMSSDGETVIHGGPRDSFVTFYRRRAFSGELVTIVAQGTSVDTASRVVGLYPMAEDMDGVYAVVKSPGAPFGETTGLVILTYDSNLVTLGNSVFISGGITNSVHGYAVDPGNGDIVVSFFEENGFTYSLLLYKLVDGGTRLELDTSISGDRPQGLDVPRALTYSPDRRQVYASGFAGRLMATVPIGGEPRRFQQPLPALRIENPVDLARSSSGQVLISSEPGLAQASEVPGGVRIDEWLRNPADRWRRLALSPDDRFLYVGYGFSSSSAILERRGDGTYAVTTEDAVFTDIFAISPDGRFLVTSFSFGDLLRATVLDSITGGLGEIRDAQVRIQNLRELRFLPDGRHLLAVGGNSEGAIGRFLSFDPSTLEINELPIGDPAILESDGLIASTDGRFVYSIWRQDSGNLTLATLERDGDDLATIFLDDLAAIGGTGDPQIEIGPNGRFLYIYDGISRLSSWYLDPSSGRPQLVDDRRQGVDGVDWLGSDCFGCSSFLLATDDRLYVANTAQSALVTLASTCQPSARTYCFQDGRFAVEIDWETQDGLTGIGQTLDNATDESGLFWFFSADNWEMVVKVLDGCNFNQNYWVFAAATTNVGFTLTVTDTWSGRVASYVNPVGASAEPIIDTGSLDLCP